MLIWVVIECCPCNFYPINVYLLCLRGHKEREIFVFEYLEEHLASAGTILSVHVAADDETFNTILQFFRGSHSRNSGLQQKPLSVE